MSSQIFPGEGCPGPTFLVTVVFWEQNYTLAFSGQWKTCCLQISGCPAISKHFLASLLSQYSNKHIVLCILTVYSLCSLCSVIPYHCLWIYICRHRVKNRQQGHVEYEVRSTQDILVPFPFISLRFVSENRTPLGAIVWVRQFLSLASLLSLLVCIFLKCPKGREGLAFTRVVIFN